MSCFLSVHIKNAEKHNIFTLGCHEFELINREKKKKCVWFAVLSLVTRKKNIFD